MSPTKKTKIVVGRGATIGSYASVADEYDYTMTHGANDNSIEGIIFKPLLSYCF